MKTFLVDLSRVDTVKAFNKKCESLPFDIDVKSGRYIIDAKSLLGLFSISLSNAVTIQVAEGNYDMAVEALAEYIVK